MPDDPRDVESQTSGDTPVCPHCFEPVDPLDHFCPKCGGPISAHACIDPMGQIYSAGYAYRQATSGRPGRLALLGIWAIFAPQAVLLLVLIRESVSGLLQPQLGQPEFLPGAGEPVGEVISILLMSGLLALYVWILWRATERYLSSSQAGEPEAETETAND